MQFSPLVNRLAGESVEAWDIHTEALAARRRGEEVFILSVGDPDFATPGAISEAAIAALRHGDTHYTEIPGRPTLRDAIAEHHGRMSGQKVRRQNVIVVAGAQNGLYSVAQCLLGPGDEAITPEPMYLTYEASIRASGADLVRVPVSPDTFRIDLQAMENAISLRTRAIFFATPCNPTGVAMTLTELEGIAALARKHDLWVVADEVYAQIIFEGRHISIAALPGMAERTVTVSSLSKSHAMAGWRVGWVVGPEALIDHLDNLLLCVLYGVPGFIQEGALAALSIACDAASEVRERYRRRRDLVIARLSAAPGLRVRRPQAGMFVLVDIRELGLSVKDFTWALFRETGVSVLDAEAFGPTAAGHVRLGFVLAEPHLEEACRRICAFCNRISAAAAVKVG